MLGFGVSFCVSLISATKLHRMLRNRWMHQCKLACKLWRVLRSRMLRFIDARGMASWSPASMLACFFLETKQKYLEYHRETLRKVWCEDSNANGQAVDARSLGTESPSFWVKDNDYRLLKSSFNNGDSSSNMLNLFLCLLDRHHLFDNPIQNLKEDFVAIILTPQK